jgi:iron(III) transport system permease protein
VTRALPGRRALSAWVALGLVGTFAAPWYALPDDVSWGPSAAAHVVVHGRLWLSPVLAVLLALALAPHWRGSRTALGGLALWLSGGGFVYLAVQALGVPRQPAVGLGALLAALTLVACFGIGLAWRGYFRGDALVATSVVGVTVIVGIFTFFPLAKILVSAVHDGDGLWSLGATVERLLTTRIWGLHCLTSARRCGVAWNTLALAVACATGCTLLGLAFALIATRTSFRAKGLLRTLTVLPIITPPFVIGLGLILIFGRAGLVNQFLEWTLGVPPTRWIYGFTGILLAQVFAFTPIAFPVLIGVVEGVSPTLEEAAQTVRADRWRTFADVSLPLMRPGLVNAFLISFIESIADFGNPIVLGADVGVLSTEIYFSIVGATLDQGRAATLALLLLAFALVAFFVQRRILGRRLYTAVTGKGDSGVPAPLPAGVTWTCYALALPWATLTAVVYAMALAGGFVKTWGRDYTLTLAHYAKAFAVESSAHGWIWAGAAWNSFFETVKLAAIAAPLTAAIGILTAYLLARQRFVGQSLFEFGTMLSFAVPGTVIGVAYILAFNVPPIEVTGTGLILVLCFIFRNLPVGVRAGMATMAQIDRSLDEASSTLGARGLTTLTRVILPLLKPALTGALIYSFVRAMTTVSAVVFLVSPDHEMATTYIIGRVINGDYGVAIAYSSALIVLMLAAAASFSWSWARAGSGVGPRAPSPPSRGALRDGRARRVPEREQALRGRDRRARRELHDRALHAGDDPRALRLRQDDDAAVVGGPRLRLGGTDPDR